MPSLLLTSTCTHVDADDFNEGGAVATRYEWWCAIRGISPDDSRAWALYNAPIGTEAG